jgi:branched-subunit amino acid aminotransferase/4-amino-4-deoxychorismate lyase
VDIDRPLQLQRHHPRERHRAVSHTRRGVREIDFTLAEVYGADEAFATGTLGGVTPVTRVDGRVIGVGRPGVVTRRIGDWYQEAIAKV